MVVISNYLTKENKIQVFNLSGGTYNKYERKWERVVIDLINGEEKRQVK